MKGISDAFSSDSDDVPLHMLQSRRESFDSEDIPLDLIATNNSDGEDSANGWLVSCDDNVYSDLLKQSLHKCDFCDDISTTRLASLRHNATHIVIPLMKLTVHQCDQCLFHFTSLEDLRTHATSKNHRTSQISDKTSRLSIAEHKEILKSIVQKQLVVRCQDTLSEVLNQSANKTNNIVNVEPVPTPLSSTTITTNPKNIVYVYDISSDSESERGAIDLCNSDTEHTEETKNYSKRKKSSPEKDNLKRGNGNTEREFGNHRHKHSDPGTENRNPERDSSPELEIITPEKGKSSQERDSSPELQVITREQIITRERNITSPERHNYLRARDLFNGKSKSRPVIENITPDRNNVNINRIFFGNTRIGNGDSRTKSSTTERDKERLRRDDSSSEAEMIIPDRDTGHLRRDDSSSEVEIISPERGNSSPERDNNQLTRILVGPDIDSISPEIDNGNMNRILFGNLSREHSDSGRENSTPERENGSLKRAQSNLERDNIPKTESGNLKRKVGRRRKKHRTSSTLESKNGNLEREISKAREIGNSRRHDNPAGGIGISRRKHCHLERERSNSESPKRESGNPETKVSNLRQEHGHSAKGIGKQRRKHGIPKRECSHSNTPERDNCKPSIGIGNPTWKHGHPERERSNSESPEREISNLIREYDSPARGIGKRKRKHSKSDKKHIDISSLQIGLSNLERKLDELKRERGHTAKDIGKRKQKHDKTEREHGHLEGERCNNSNTLEKEYGNPETDISNTKTEHGDRERENSSTSERVNDTPEKEISNMKIKHGDRERGNNNTRETENGNPEKEISNMIIKHSNRERERSCSLERVNGNLVKEISNYSKRNHSHQEKEDSSTLERERGNPERKNGNLGKEISKEREVDNSRREHDHPARGIGKLRRKHGSIERESSNSSSTEKDNCNPEREIGNRKRKHRHQASGIGNLRRRNSNPARGICNPKKRRKIHGNPERENFSQEERNSDPKRDPGYPEREPNSPARDKGIVDRVNSPEREHANAAREHFDAEREHLNTVREDANAEREHFNTKIEYYNTEREHDNTEKDTDTSERENGSSETEDQRSSPFDQLRLEMSPSQLTEPSSPCEPISNRIMFEDDYNDDDSFEPEKPYQPNSCIIGTKANSLQTRELPDLYSYTFKRDNEKIVPDLYSYTSNRDKQKIVPDLYSYTSIGDNSNRDTKITERETIWIPNSFSNRDLEWNPNYCIIGNHKPLEESGEKIEESYTESEHFDVLVAPLLCDCRYCGRCFGNRFELIKHETTHMRARPKHPILCCVCERYLAGNHWALRKHMQIHHPHNDSNRKRQRCKVCHFSYHNYLRHVRYYHRSTCGTCNRSFDSDNPLTHKCIDLKSYDKSYNLGDPDLATDTKVIIKMCEMCLAFAKNKINVHYDVIGVHSEIGSRQECDKCRIMCFEVNLVRRTIRAREMHHGQTWGKKKPLSNQERLKKMQNRLKMANKMNKH